MPNIIKSSCNGLCASRTWWVKICLIETIKLRSEMTVDMKNERKFGSLWQASDQLPRL